MAQESRRAVLVAGGLLLAAAAAGGGWVAGRRSLPPPPPPPEFLNPLRDAAKGEFLAIGDASGSRTSFRVIESMPDTVLLEIQDLSPGAEVRNRTLRVARTYFGAFLVLDGDQPPEDRLASVRDLVVDRMVPETRRALDRDLPCWRLEARHRTHGAMKIWISDAVPVHGLVRIETGRYALDVLQAETPR